MKHAISAGEGETVSLIPHQKMDALSRSIQRARVAVEGDYPPSLVTGELDLMERWLADFRAALSSPPAAMGGETRKTKELAAELEEWLHKLPAAWYKRKLLERILRALTASRDAGEKSNG